MERFCGWCGRFGFIVYIVGTFVILYYGLSNSFLVNSGEVQITNSLLNEKLDAIRLCLVGVWMVIAGQLSMNLLHTLRRLCDVTTKDGEKE
ncbi:hypothetical protein ACFL0Z_03110 [Patescibacteria group bacterium]